MFLRLHFPPLPLGLHVGSITYYRELGSAHARERLLPEGGVVHIVIDLTESPKKRYQTADGVNFTEFRESWISGAHDRWIVIGSEQGSSMLVIEFRPGGAYPFLRLPLDLLKNTVLPLDSVVGAQSARALRQGILDAPDANAKFAVAEDWLLRRVNEVAVDPVVAFLAGRLHAGDRASVAAALDATGYSQRHASGLFRQWVGLSPKQFHRLRRFAAVRRHVARAGLDPDGGLRQFDWSDLAAAFGYADQLHMNRDFRDFAGISPGAYARVAMGIDNYLPVDDVTSDLSKTLA